MTAFRLRKDERILWQGRPVRRRLFRISDVAATGTAGALAVLIVVLDRVGFFGPNDFVLFPAWTAPALTLCQQAGSVLCRAVWWRRTVYVLTTRRVVVIGGRSGGVRMSCRLTTLERPVVTERADGSGSLAFGRFPTLRDSFAVVRQNPAKWLLHIDESGRPVFWDVADIRTVRRRVTKARARARRAWLSA